MESKATKTKRIIYSPPSPAAVEKFARAVCEKFGAGDNSYLSSEVVSGFAGFLVLATKIQAKHLTKTSEMEQKLDSTAD